MALNADTTKHSDTETDQPSPSLTTSLSLILSSSETNLQNTESTHLQPSLSSVHFPREEIEI